MEGSDLHSILGTFSVFVRRGGEGEGRERERQTEREATVGDLIILREKRQSCKIKYASPNTHQEISVSLKMAQSNKPYIRHLTVGFCIPLHITINFAVFNYVQLKNFTFSQDAKNNSVCTKSITAET